MGQNVGRPWASPGDPQGSRKEFSSAIEVCFVGSVEGAKGSPGHLRGVLAVSSGNPLASSGIPRDSLGGPRARWGPFQSLRWDLVFRPQNIQERNKS